MKKRIVCIVLALCMVLPLAACVTEAPPSPAGDAGAAPATAPAVPAPAGAESAPAPAPAEAIEAAEAFPGRIAIITNDVSQNEEEFRSAEALVEKYGPEKIIHRTWPVNFVTEGEQMITIVQQIADDPEVRALVINQSVVGTNAAVDKLLEIRDDVFIVYCSPAENPPDVAARAHLILNTNDPLRGETIVAQAIAMGADTIAHYTFPRHMAVAQLAMRRDVMRAAAEREGITFVELPAPDPTGPDGIPGTQQFILEDVPRQVEALGPNTAFFATNCAMQTPLQIQVIETGALYPEPCCPSPYHAFPVVLGISDRIFDGTNVVDGEDKGRLRSVTEVVSEIKSELANRGATGRLATWPVPAAMMWTTVGAEYAIRVLNGEVPMSSDVSYELLSYLMSNYIYELTGEDIGVELNPLSITGRSFHNYVLGIIESLVF